MGTGQAPEVGGYQRQRDDRRLLGFVERAVPKRCAVAERISGECECQWVWRHIHPRSGQARSSREKSDYRPGDQIPGLP